jgi:RNase P subunit RPR2
MEANYVVSKCKVCEWGVLDFSSCSKCKCPLHSKCGFRVQKEDTIITICKACGEGKKDSSIKH